MRWTEKDAKEILKLYNIKNIAPKQLLTGMFVELEHSKGKYNIANRDKYITAKIALAHLDEDKKYYEKLKKVGL